MDYVLPAPNYLSDKEWQWPFNKFSLHPEDLFTTLHDRFNTHKLPLQDPVAFREDVCESARYSATLDEFYSQLEARKIERIKEMNKGWDNVCALVAATPSVMACQLCYDKVTHKVKTKPGTMNDSMPERWLNFVQFSRSPSFDNLVKFFDGFVRDERKQREDLDRWATEGLARIRRKKAMAKQAAAAPEAIEAAAAESASPISSVGGHKQQISSCATSTSEAATASTAPTDEPRPTSSSGRHGRRQTEATTPSRTTESSITRKRKSEEDIHGSGRKKCRMTNEGTGDNDIGRPTAGQVKSTAAEIAESTPAIKQALKRKRAGDSQDEASGKRPKITDGPTIAGTQSPRWSPNPNRFDRNASPTYSNPESLPSTAVPSDYGLDLTDEKSARRNPEALALHPPSENSFEIIDASQASPQREAEGLVAKETATEITRTRKSKRKSQASRKQRVDKRRSGVQHETSSLQKQPRQKKRQERRKSPYVEQLLHSKRSSRRDAGQKLWCLGDDATACVVTNTRKI